MRLTLSTGLFLLAGLTVLCSPTLAGTLDLEQRTAIQDRLERFYFSQQEGATRSFEQTYPTGLAGDKVAQFLRQSEALAAVWRRPLTRPAVLREFDRVATNTQSPRRLVALYDVLDGDPAALLEGVIRPALARRLSRSFFETERRTSQPAEPHFSRWLARQPTAPVVAPFDYSAEELQRVDDAMQALRGGPCIPQDVWSNGALDDVLLPVKQAAMVWTGSEVLIWGGSYGYRYDPALQTFTPMSTVNAPTSYDGSFVWTGTELIVWGGRLSSGSSTTVDTGGRYDPATDSWTPTSAVNAPAARGRHTAVWTGSEMIVWGGTTDLSTHLDSGGRYDPLSDSWSPTSKVAAPVARDRHGAVWTGSRMIVTGGTSAANSWLGDGGEYDPIADTWIATATDATPGRRDHAAVWTGSEMVIWGGENAGVGDPYLDTGRRYDPVGRSWSDVSTVGAPGTSPTTRAVWSGTEMIVWGGCAGCGGRWNPASDSWTAISDSGAPSERTEHSLAWTGGELIVWGGGLASGGRYSPAGDSWVATEPLLPIPTAESHTAVWTGTELIVWGGVKPAGGSGPFGFRYDPMLDVLSAMPTFQEPLNRTHHTAVWTGTEMIVWGGQSAETTSVRYGNGGIYTPATDQWRFVGFGGPQPEARTHHSAVWSGSQMIVWGGWGGSSVTPLNNGSRYDPEAEFWYSMTTTDAPTARRDHRAVWTGSEMIVWGGRDDTVPVTYDDGKRYDPVSDSWTAVSATGAPQGRFLHSAVWTGDEMIVWGGLNTGPTLADGGRYSPAGDSWAAVSASGAPASRRSHQAVWTGDEMVVWGGQSGGFSETTAYLAAGGSYDPAGGPDGSWVDVPLTGNPGPRSLNTLTWAGDRMYVWGGKNDGGTLGNGGALLIDGDGDGDTVCDLQDNCPGDADPTQSDGDLDGLGDVCDNCPGDANPDQSDLDADGIGDACDVCSDADFDTICDDVDNCVGAYNADQSGQRVLISGPPLDNGSVQEFVVSGAPGDPVVVYSADEDEDNVVELYSRRLFGGGRIKLSPPQATGGDVTDFQVTGDERYVYYMADQEYDGRKNVYSVPIDGGQVRRASPTTGTVGRPARIETDADDDVLFATNQASLYGTDLDGFGWLGYVEWNGDSGLGAWTMTPDRATAVYNIFEEQGDTGTLWTSAVSPGGHSGPLFSPSVIGLGPPTYTVSPTGAHVVITDHDLSFNQRLLSIPISGGSATELVPVTEPFSSFEFTDGLRLLYRSGSDLRSVPLSGGAATTAVTGLPGPSIYASRGGRLVYTAAIDDPDNTDLYTVSIGGGTPVKLNPAITTVDGDVVDFQFTPDGTTVLFSGEIDTPGRTDLYTVPAGGGTAVRIVPQDPSSSVLAFSVENDATVLFRTDGATVLQAAPTSGGAITPISGADQVAVADEMLLPGGIGVIYRTQLSGGADWELALYLFDSGGATEVCDCIDLDGDGYGRLGGLACPAGPTPDCDDLSPECNIDCSDGDGDGIPDCRDRCPEIPADDSGPIQLSNAAVVQGSVQSFRPAPTGVGVAYLADQDTDGTAEIYGSGFEAGGAARINGSTAVTDYDLSATGVVVYLADELSLGREDLYGVPLAGGSPLRLTNDPAVNPSLGDFLLTPNGTRAVFRHSNHALYSVPTVGGPTTTLTNPEVFPWANPGYYITRDSQYVVFVNGTPGDMAEEWAAVDGSAWISGIGGSISWPGAVSADSAWHVNAAEGTTWYAVGSGRLDGTAGATLCSTGLPPFPPYPPPVGITPVPILGLHYAVYWCSWPMQLESQRADGGGKIVLDTTVGQGDVRVIGFTGDGTRVVYMVDGVLKSVPVLGGTVVTLAPDPVAGGEIVEAEVTPDGRFVIFRADLEVDERFDLYAVSPAGGTVIKLHGVLAGDVTGFAISPRSDAVVYRADEFAGRFDLYWVRLDGSAPRKLNGSMQPQGDVHDDFALTGGGQIVLYRADALTDGVDELFAVILGHIDSDQDGAGDACDSCPFDALDDGDADGLCADVDNCPADANPGQEDTDGDGDGDACDLCPGVVNPGQADADGDLVGDACDNCVQDANANQLDSDTDTVGDACDNCPLDVNTTQDDGDGDLVGDVCDNCPADVNTDQANSDNDPLGDVCDNCPLVDNPAQLDGDGDLAGDVCDPCPADPLDDADADSVCGDVDNCPNTPNTTQSDADLDGTGDACDACTDGDADGFGNPGFPVNACLDDNCPFVANPTQADSEPPSSLWQSRSISTLTNSPRSVFAADLDGDDDVDVLSASSSDNEISWFENVGAGVFGPQQLISDAALGARSVVAADVDGDLDNDVLSASYSGDELAWYENTDGNGTFGPKIVVGTGADGARSIFAVDVDGDFDVDVVAASFLDDTIAWYENVNGDGSGWIPHTVSTGADGAWSVYAADLDGDNDVDVAAASFLDNTVAWYENTDGAGITWSAHVVSSVAGGADSVFVADIDGDNDPDLLSASFLDDTIAWYENTDGSGSFGAKQVISTLADGARAVFAADVDGDGDDDVLSASATDDEVAWYENTDGNGSFGAQAIITSLAGGAESCFAADLDGVGRLDVLAAAADDDQVNWYVNRGDGVGDVCDNCPDAVNVDQLDGDADGLGDVCDNCPGDPNPSQLDGDSDGAGDVCDCAPADPGVLDWLPAPGGLVLLNLGGSSASLTWSAVSGADKYMLTRADLSSLAAGQYGACVDSNIAATTFVESAMPAPGAGFAYLVQASSALCGDGSLGFDGEGVERVNGDPGACP